MLPPFIHYNTATIHHDLAHKPFDDMPGPAEFLSSTSSPKLHQPAGQEAAMCSSLDVQVISPVLQHSHTSTRNRQIPLHTSSWLWRRRSREATAVAGGTTGGT
ncbi:unnamed protein product [Urochloa humidicola]